LLGVTQIGADEDRAPTVPLRKMIGFVAAANSDLGTGGQECFRDASADASTASGD